MPSTLFYFIQVILCSAVMYGYYLLFLRNKKFHQYNRFYLLAVLVVPWLVPLARIPVVFTSPAQQPAPLKFFGVIADNNTQLEEAVSIGSNSFHDWNGVAIYIYLSVSCLLLIQLVAGLARMLWLLKRSDKAPLANGVLVYTDAKGTPFSFFRYIFWNCQADIDSTTGRQILAHELTHVRQRHSVDKIIASVAIIFGWFNPFSWLARKELDMVHEFIADEKAVGDDTAGLAAMLLAAACPGFTLPIANPFFHSPVKRRITMMTKMNLTRYPFMRRVMVLPLCCMIVALVAFRKQDHRQAAPALDSVYTIVVDAGHGGKDKGAIAADGTTEAMVALDISKRIRELNMNPKLKVILLREDDTYIHPVDKAEMVRKEKADLFVSVHVNNQEKGIGTRNGIEIFLPGTDTLNKYRDSYIFANAIGTFLEKINPKTTLKVRKNAIWVLQHSNCPSALIECGYMSDAKDFARLKTSEYKDELAKKILAAAEQYLYYKEIDKTMK